MAGGGSRGGERSVRWGGMRETILDGGMATQLEAQGADLSSILWSAAMLGSEEGREEVEKAHRRFVEAGAHVATTVSYQASPEGFEAADIGEYGERVGESVRLARKSGAQIVAGSIGPFGACLADGSEYSGKYRVWKEQRQIRKSRKEVDGEEREVGEIGTSFASLEWLRTFHRRRLEVMLSADPDVVAFETIPCVSEAAAIGELIQELVHGSKVGVWVSFCVGESGTELVSGESLVEAVEAVEKRSGYSKNLIAVGVNCCAPQAALEATKLFTTSLPSPSPSPSPPHVLGYVIDKLKGDLEGDEAGGWEEFVRMTRGLWSNEETRYVRRWLVYPNSGEGWDADEAKWIGVPSHHSILPQLLALPIAGIGGCCRVTPEQIKVIVEM